MRDFAFRAGRSQGGRGWLIDRMPFDPRRTDGDVGAAGVEVWRPAAEDMGTMANLEVT